MPPDPLELVLHAGPATVLRWVVCLAVTNPLVTLAHELGHAAVALRLTRNHVLVRMDGRRLRHVCLGKLHIDLALPGSGGACVSREVPGRYGIAKVAVAGPLVSLVTGMAAFGAWHATGWVPLGAFACQSLLAAVFNGAPLRVAKGGRWHVSDGLRVAQALGLVRPPRRPRSLAGPIIGLPAAVLLVGAGVAVLAVDPLMLLLLVPLFAFAYVNDVRDRSEAIEASAPPQPEAWDTTRSLPPPGGR